MRHVSYSVLTLLSTLYSSVALADELFVDDALLIADDVATHVTPVEQSAPGLPQLDPTYFASQLFWLAICGLILYVVMARFALPRIANLQTSRDTFVQDHLHQAAQLRSQAETAKISYELALREAESKAKTLLTDTAADLSKKNELAMHDAMDKVQKTIDQAEARLLDQKQQIMATVDQQATILAQDILTTVFQTKIGRAA
jgi:F-type H+-transporting ATPase subunit b